MKLTSNLEKYPIGVTFSRNLFAAQCYATKYFYTGEYAIQRRRKDGKRFARKIGGRRGYYPYLGGSWDESVEMEITSSWVQVRFEGGVRVGKLIGNQTSVSRPAPAGTEWKTDEDGHGYISRISDGMDYHPGAEDMRSNRFAAVIRAHLVNNRLARIATAKAAKEIKRIHVIKDREIRSCRVTLEDSRRAGNCVQGSLNYAESRLGIPRQVVLDNGYLFSVSAARLLDTNGQPGVKRAVEIAWLRETTVCI